MKKFPILILFLAGSCSPKPVDNEKSKAEIIQTENDFSRMAKEKGAAEAFYAFADSSAVIRRGDQIVEGKEAIKNFYTNRKQQGELQWSPDFADASGDLGYTYGKFVYTETNLSGLKSETTGFFHTVWKKQKDGSWKFVWD